MVVDDEQIVLDAMGYIIEKRGDQVILCATASSGREAIEVARIHHPDILFMDIRMPGLSGIEAIEEIQTFSPATKCVIISAYEQFEYAKQAVKLSVKDYLLKPINRNKVNQVIDKLASEIQRERIHRQIEMDHLEKIRNMMPHMETVFIYALLFNHTKSANALTTLELLGIEQGQGCIATLELREQVADGSAGNHGVLDDKLCSEREYQLVRDVIKSTQLAIVGPVMLNKVVIFLPIQDSVDAYDARVCTMSRAERICQQLRQLTHRNCAMGLSNSYPLLDLHYAYQESIKALREIQGSGIFHIADLYGEDTGALEADKLKVQLIQMTEQGKADQALIAFERLFPLISGQREACLELMVHIYRTAASVGLTEDGIIHYKTYLKDVMTIEDTQMLSTWIATTLRHVCLKIEQMKVAKCSKVIEQTKAILKHDYPKEVTLEGVARMIQMSPQYLSKLFKEQTGSTFIDYLTDLRLEEAKRLMSLGQLSIKEICFKVGYTDPNYFSRVFKKRSGVNPTDFNKNAFDPEVLLQMMEVNHGKTDV